MTATVADGPLRGQRYACGSEYRSDGNSRALTTAFSLMGGSLHSVHSTPGRAVTLCGPEGVHIDQEVVEELVKVAELSCLSGHSGK